MMVAAVLSTVEAKEVVLRKGKKGEGDALMKRCVMLLFWEWQSEWSQVMGEVVARADSVDYYCCNK